MNRYKKRQRNLYKKGQKEPFTVSRSKIELFYQCQRCFYLDRKLGLGRPSMPGWALNSAVDHLLKNEFDLLREKGQKHALMEKYGLDAIPFKHKDLPEWRGDISRFSGAKYLHKKTNLMIDGLVDDIWVNKDKELLIVDYKSTSTEKEISLDDEYKEGFKRQMEIYQWLFRQLGFKVSDTGYFVYANGLKGERTFDGKLDFDLILIPYDGNDNWVEPTILAIKETLDNDKLPEPAEDCEYCAYRDLIKMVEV